MGNKVPILGKLVKAGTMTSTVASVSSVLS